MKLVIDNIDLECPTGLLGKAHFEEHARALFGGAARIHWIGDTILRVKTIRKMTTEVEATHVQG